MSLLFDELVFDIIVWYRSNEKKKRRELLCGFCISVVDNLIRLCYRYGFSEN